METSINERVKQIVDRLGYKSIRQFAIKINIAPTSLNDVVKNNAEPKFSTLDKIIKAEPSISPDWLLTGKGEMLKMNLPIAIPDLTGIPLYRTEAAAGFGNNNFSIEEKDIEARYKIKELESVSFMLHVRGDSMTPTYNNGDIIAVQVVRDNRNIQWGKPHLVSSKSDGLLVKRIYDGEGSIIAASDNPTYRPIHIRKEDVTGIAIVKGFLRVESY